jgi:hypothetical protein
MTTLPTVSTSVTGLLRETAFYVALAYLLAFAVALINHVERVTGRRDHKDYRDLMPPDPVCNKLWRAKSTVERARKLAADNDLMCSAARDYPSFAAVAEKLAADLLASR